MKYSSRPGALRAFIFLLLPVVASCGRLHAESTVNVSTLLELCEAVRKSDQTIIMKPGRYTLTELPERSRRISCSGSNNRIELSGVNVNIPVGTTRKSYITMSGDNNTFKGGEFEDTYKSGLEEVTDFSSYNKNRSTLARGLAGSAVFSVSGDNNRIVGTKLTVRGSFPYGYGSIYGIGADNVFGLDKRCGILIKGKSNTVDGCEIQQSGLWPWDLHATTSRQNGDQEHPRRGRHASQQGSLS